MSFSGYRLLNGYQSSENSERFVTYVRVKYKNFDDVEFYK